MAPRCVLYAIVCAALAGCALSPRAGHPAPTAWLARRGGLATGPAQARAARALARLALPDGQRPGVQVLADDALGAFAWPDGRIVVTRGLVDGVGDAALAAAVAHEVGHLVLGGHLDGNGLPRDGRADDEAAADRVARALLERSGLDVGALTDLLAALEARAAPASRRRARLAARCTALGGASAL